MRLCHLSLAAALLTASGLAAAEGDVVQMPPAEGAAAETQPMQIEMPIRGMTKREVEAKFGAPMEKIPAVGEPPISRWVYADYTVYFEKQYVIHSVLNRK